jgi:hypothetical protein
MPFVIALAVREMRMTSAEALVAATVGGARALRRGDIGRIAVGGRADLAVLEAPSYRTPRLPAGDAARPSPRPHLNPEVPAFVIRPEVIWARGQTDSSRMAWGR